MSGKAVIVIAFPEPPSVFQLGLKIEKAKKFFEDEEDVKAYLGINNVSEAILDILETKEESDSGLVAHARREMELIENDPWMIEGVVKVVRAFAEMGHSGGSASIAIPIINQLLQFKNLSELTNDPKEWNEVADGIWQSSRNSEAFSNDAGEFYYILSDKNRVLRQTKKVEKEEGVTE